MEQTAILLLIQASQSLAPLIMAPCVKVEYDTIRIVW